MATTEPVNDSAASSNELTKTVETNKQRIKHSGSAVPVADVASPEVLLDPNNVKVPATEVTAEFVKKGKEAIPEKRPSPTSLLKRFSAPASKHTHDYNTEAHDVILAQFDNPVFEAEIDTSRMSFADVVRKVMEQSVEPDYHPYGRGNLYTSIIYERPKISRDEGHLFVWILVMVAVLGLAGAVIIMSIAYESKREQQLSEGVLGDDIVNMTATTT